MIHTHVTHTRYTHTHDTHTRYIHTIHTHDTHTRYTHTHDTHTRFIHTIHTHNTHTRYIHTIHTRDTYTHGIYTHEILIERSPPPRGGFLFIMFPDQEPCVRDCTTRCDGRISSWNLLHTTRLLIREHSKQKTPPGGGGSFDQYVHMVYVHDTYTHTTHIVVYEWNLWGGFG